MTGLNLNDKSISSLQNNDIRTVKKWNIMKISILCYFDFKLILHYGKRLWTFSENDFHQLFYWHQARLTGQKTESRDHTNSEIITIESPEFFTHKLQERSAE